LNSIAHSTDSTSPVPATDATTYRAAGLYAATIGYDEALRLPDPAARLDRMSAEVDEIAADLARVVNAEGGTEFIEGLREATAVRLSAFAAIEHGRAELADAGVGYLFDLLADNLKAGVDPHVIRRDALAAPARVRELARQA